MVSQIIIGTILLCLCTFAQQFNAVYGVALEDHLNSYDSTRDSIGHLSDVMKSSHYNSSILSDLLDSVDSLSTLINRKTNEFVAKLCNLNTGQLCKYYGYKSENFTVTTTDGYILTVFRCYGKIIKVQPVLLIHGMMDSSDSWAMNPGSKSLAYDYIEHGYDVYMVNCRGNRYSQRHITLVPQQSAFWNFSWQEMARYDLPETIDTILKRTDTATIQCVGHSQGATILLVLLTIQPRYNQIITHTGLMAPFTFMNQIGFPINAVIAAFYKFEYHHYWPFAPHTFFQKIAAHSICELFDGKLCNLFLNFILGPSLKQFDGDMLPVYVCHFPAGCSSKQLWHFGQELHCNYFGEFMDVPPPVCKHPLPSFNLTSITTALFLFYSPTDPHTHPINIKILQRSLSHANLATKEIYEYNHMEFVWGKNAVIDVYEPLIARAAQFMNT